MSNISIEVILNNALGDLSFVRIVKLDETIIISGMNNDALIESIRDIVIEYQKTKPNSLILVAVKQYQFGTQLEIGLSPCSDRVHNISEKLIKAHKNLLKIIKEDKGTIGKIGTMRDGMFFITFAYPKKSDESERKIYIHKSDDLSWNQYYVQKLINVEWNMLREEIYRFAREGELVIKWAHSRGLKTAYCPAVGLCIDPWVFAYAGFNVLSLDVSIYAMETLSNPDKNPILYSMDAKNAWEIEAALRWYGHVNPFSFSTMPDVATKSSRDELSSIMMFVTADMSISPIKAKTVDVIFACNALPREEEADWVPILEDWVRILSPEGLIYIHMHNCGLGEKIINFFLSSGLIEVPVIKYFADKELLEQDNILPDASMSPKKTPGYFQVVLSSG